MNSTINQLERGIVIGLKLTEISNSTVLRILEENNIKCSRQSIDRIWAQWKEEGKSYSKVSENSGRNKILTKGSVDQLKEFAAQNPSASKRELSNSQVANPQNVSANTLMKAIKDEGFFQRSVKHIIEVSEENKILRVKWAKKLLRESKTDIKNGIYTDETWMIFQNDVKGLVWQNDESQKVIKSLKRWPQKIMVWGAITITGPISIKFINDSLNQDTYLNILEEFFEENQDLKSCVFQQDNARPHTGKKVTQFFEDNEIRVLPWASQSPDINPIERVWGMLKSKINKIFDTIDSFEEFQRQIENIFFNDQDIKQLIINTIRNIPQHLSKLIEKNGNIIT
ncbi:hypothetical protein ABPG72_018584 [Tetrahymena utriculariae]